jgi:hypothetical protein
MKHVKLFEAFSTSTFLTEDQIDWLNKCAKGNWKLNQSTGLIDVDGGFYCGQQDLTDFKGVAFGHVKDGFYCNNNLLTSLVGAPQTVGGDFYCENNRLTSLEGAPETVNGNFSCSGNQLTSLKEAPQTVGGGFSCSNNQLTSLVEAPQTVNGYFSCNNNQLTSLEGAPQTVGRSFYCHNNPVPEETLASIFALMKNGKTYQQALEEYWPNMDDKDRVLMYKDLKDLTPEEIRRYEALTTVNRMKQKWFQIKKNYL